MLPRDQVPLQLLVFNHAQFFKLQPLFSNLIIEIFSHQHLSILKYDKY